MNTKNQGEMIKVMQVNTCHVPPSALEYAHKTECGYELDVQGTLDDYLAAPDVLFCLAAHAHEKKCKKLRLMENGPIYEGLPVYS